MLRGRPTTIPTVFGANAFTYMLPVRLLASPTSEPLTSDLGCPPPETEAQLYYSLTAKVPGPLMRVFV